MCTTVCVGEGVMRVRGGGACTYARARVCVCDGCVCVMGAGVCVCDGCVCVCDGSGCVCV